MASKQTHLMNRNGRFYFRYYVPVFMQERFGCKEFIYSLKTKDYHAAKAKIGVLLAMAEVIMKEVKQGRLTPEQATEVAGQYFRQCLERMEKQLDAAEEWSIAIIEKMNRKPVEKRPSKYPSLDILEDAATFDGIPTEPEQGFPLTEGFDYLYPPLLDTALKSGGVYFSGKVTDDKQVPKALPEIIHGIQSGQSGKKAIDYDAIYEYCLNKYGLQDIQPETYSYKTFTDMIDKAIEELRNIHQQKLDHVRDADLKFKYDCFRDTTSASSAPQKTLPQQQPSGMPLKELIKRFIAERMRGENWTDRTKKDREAQFALLSEWLGDDFDITCLDAEKAAEVKIMLQELPKHRHKKPETRDLSLTEALTVKDVEKLNTRTVNEYLMAYQPVY